MIYFFGDVHGHFTHVIEAVQRDKPNAVVFLGDIQAQRLLHLESQVESQAEFVRRCGKGNRWRGGLPRKHRSTIFESDWLHLSQQRADILITHEAPGCHPYGFEALNELGLAMRVSRTFHGHQHDNLDYSEQFTRLGRQAFGVGFCGITDQDGRVVRPGDLAERREGRQSPTCNQPPSPTETPHG